MDKQIIPSVRDSRLGAYWFGHGIVKVASHVQKSLSDDVNEYIRSIKPDPRYRYILLNALGAGEYYGPNENGDFFPEDELKRHYKTFYDSHPYRFHINRDPAHSYGKVLLSSWNPRMKRVELIIAIDKQKAPEIVEKIDNGDNLGFSMGCITDPNYPVLTLGGYKPISEVSVGDYVYTHKKRWRRVTELHRRRWTGKLCKAKINGLPIPLEMTSDHPMMAKVFDMASVASREDYIVKRYFTSGKFDVDPPDWVHAGHLNVGDRLFYNAVVYDRAMYTEIDDVNLSKFMGFFLAEGTIEKNGDRPASVSLHCNINDRAVYEIKNWINHIWHDVTVSIRARAHSRVAICVSIFSSHLADFCKMMIGSGAHNKKIPPEIFVSSDAVRLAFLGGWYSGDGFKDLKGIHWSTCSENLALQGRDLLASLGIPSSIYKNNHKAGSGKSTKDTIEYTLNVAPLDASRLAPYVSGALDEYHFGDRTRPASMRKTSDGSYAYRIKEIETREVTDIQTYNFEVEEDESYTLAGLVSHNCRVEYDICSICGNKAKNRTEYCEHLQKYMGKAMPDGRQVYAINPRPKFFDISQVKNPADKTAYMLKKIASALEEEPPVQIITLDIPEDDQIKLGESELEMVTTILPILELTDPTFSEETLQKLGSENFDQVLATTLGLGIVLKPEEFQYIALSNMGHGKLASDLYRSNSVMAFPVDEKKISLGNCFSISNVSEKVASTISDYIEHRTLISPVWDHRLLKFAAENREIIIPEKKYISSPAEMIPPLAASYLTYRMLSGENGQGFVEHALRKSVLGKLLLLALGASLVSGLQGIQPKDEQVKKSAKIEPAAVALGSVAIPYLWAAHSRQKEYETGETPGPLGKFVADNPGLSAIGLSAGSALGISKLKKFFAAKKLGR